MNRTTRGCGETGAHVNPCWPPSGYAFKIVHCETCEDDLCNGVHYIEETTEYHRTDTDGSSNLAVTKALIIFAPIMFFYQQHICKEINST